MSTNTNEQVFDINNAVLYIKKSFNNLGDSFYNLLLYIKKNAIIVGLITVLGIAYGRYQDSEDDSFTNEIIVKPNFGSADYLYSKVELLKSKIEQKDSVYLVKNGFINHKKISKLVLEPIIDPYRFMSASEKNSDYFRVLINDADLETVIKNERNETLFLFHKLTFTSKGKVSDNETVAQLLNYLNDSEFYNKQKDLEYAAKQFIINGLDSTINQIDLTIAKNIQNGTSNVGKMIYFDSEEKVSNVFEQKSELLTERAEQIAVFNTLDKTIKDISIISNIKEKAKIYQKKTVTTPLFFMFLFALFIKFKRFLTHQKLKRQ